MEFPIKTFFVALVAICMETHHIASRPPHADASLSTVQDPVQETIVDGKRWAHKGFHFTPLARYDVTALVLHTERYRSDPSAPISPVDWALGWGPMANAEVLKKISISQFGRWYYYHTREQVLKPDNIVAHSANTHIIPATEELAQMVKTVHKGDVIHARGQLVSVESINGFHWISSLSRTDTGDGSCEVLWLESLEIQ